MYSVSADFMTALHQPARFEKIRGTIGSVSFDDSNIISLSYSNRCSDTSDVTFGSAYIGQIDATFVNVNISRGDWRDKVITLQWGLVLPDDSIEYIPIGKFTVTSAEWSAQGVTVKASDIMAKLDKQFTLTNTSGTLYDLLSLAALNCSLTLGVTQEEVYNMPNGSEFLGLYAESDVKTWRDFVSWIAQTAGGFAYATRDGKLAIKSFAELEEVDELTQFDRDYNSAFSDYSTRYEGVSVVNIADNTTSYYRAGLSGAVINLGANPFLQYGTQEDISNRRYLIARIATTIQYTPFTSNVLSCGVYDLGDIIKCSGGFAGDHTLYCCVMGINWSTKQQTQLSGYGADPSLTSGKSKTDKVLDGLMSKEGLGNKIGLVTYANASAYNIDDTWRLIAQLRVGVLEGQVLQLHGLVKLNLTEPGIVKVRYKVNAEPLPFIHVCQFPIGTDTITLFIPVPVSNEAINDIDVEIMSDDGLGTIAINDVQILIQGVGVTTGDWDGYIEIEDTFAFPLQSGLGFAYVDTPTISTNALAHNISASDSFAFPFQAGLGFSYAETQNTRIALNPLGLSLTLEDGSGHIITEDEKTILTEE